MASLVASIAVDDSRGNAGAPCWMYGGRANAATAFLVASFAADISRDDVDAAMADLPALAYHQQQLLSFLEQALHPEALMRPLHQLLPTWG